MKTHHLMWQLHAVYQSLCVLHAGAPNVAELTFDRESRTLTCTSTGGPATTVTWTKDGAVITPSTTHQQTQMIVDTVEGIYQNTLTIAQSVTGDNLYGLYSCMVENSRGSSNRTVYFYGKHKIFTVTLIYASFFLLFNFLPRISIYTHVQ